eukprot:2879582-Pleurochrysis_carterae.AAC.2
MCVRVGSAYAAYNWVHVHGTRMYERARRPRRKCVRERASACECVRVCASVCERVRVCASTRASARLDALVLGEDLGCGAPRLVIEDASAREHQLPILVFTRDDLKRVRAAQLEDLLRPAWLLDGRLGERDVGGRLDADVDERAVGLEAEHHAVACVAALEREHLAHRRR